MRPNARRTTLADIAQAAGVSVATVSKVVNGRGDVAPHTRTRVQELLHQHHYLAPVFRHTEAAEIPTIEVQFKGASSRTWPRPWKASSTPRPSRGPRW